MHARENRLKTALQNGEVVLGCSLQELHARGVIYTLAGAGIEFLFIDMEHQPFTIETVADIVADTHGAGMTPVVRIPNLDHSTIVRLLDTGCQSILVPQLSSPEEVDRLLQFALYHPVGVRGIGDFGARTGYQLIADNAEFERQQNDQLFLGLIIETKEAVEAIDEMLRPGITLAMLGPADLAQAYGIPGQTTHDIVKGAGDRVLAACRERGLAFGRGVRDLDGLQPAIDSGAQFLHYSGVLQFLHLGARAALEAIGR